MKEYISKEYLYSILSPRLNDSRGAEHYAYDYVKQEIDDVPGICKKEIVECRYCKWFDPDENIMPESGRCHFHEMVKMFWDFCSRGKRNE